MGLKNVYEKQAINQISFLQKLTKHIELEMFHQHFRFYLRIASSYGCCDEFSDEKSDTRFDTKINERLFAYVMTCDEFNLLPNFYEKNMILEDKFDEKIESQLIISLSN